MKILVTGGAGYIGSHFLERWIGSAHAYDSKIWVVDDLSGGHLPFIEALRVLAKEKGVAEFHFDKRSLLDTEFIDPLVSKIQPDIVFHFAGKISVAESVANPDLYFNGNVKATKLLLQSLSKTSCRRLVFSSTAAVYQTSQSLEPLSETSPLGPSSPYGENKLQVEQMLAHAAKDWGLRSVVLRYFNAAGASESGKFGEWHEPETHLIPLLLAAALKGDEKLRVFGSDYPTTDGSCVRDFIHVSDLAQAHLLAAEYLQPLRDARSEVFNLGTSQGVSVLQMIETASRVIGKPVQYELSPRRDGDTAFLVAAAQKAREVLGWKPERSLEQIIRSAAEWEQKRLGMSKA